MASVSVTTLSGKTITVNVEATDTMRSIKGKVEGMEGIDRRAQRLLVNRSELKDTMMVSECGVHNSLV